MKGFVALLGNIFGHHDYIHVHDSNIFSQFLGGWRNLSVEQLKPPVSVTIDRLAHFAKLYNIQNLVFFLYAVTCQTLQFDISCIMWPTTHQFLLVLQ